MVSVIVPVYNTEERIKICLQSICKQTYATLQIIVINDGSTDKTSLILEEFKNSDPRIQIIEQKNSGVSSARNIGLKIAKGDWIAFVDSDDYLEDGYIEKMLENDDGTVDVIISGYKVRKETIEALTLARPKETFQNDEEITNLLLQNGWRERLSLWGPWGKIISRKLICEHKILFDENVSLGEDELFVLDCYSRARKIVCVYNQDYIVWKREGSLSARNSSVERSLTPKLLALDKKIGIFKKKGMYQKKKQVNQLVYDTIKFPTVNLIMGKPYSFAKIKSSYDRLFLDENVQNAACDYVPPKIKDKILRRIVLMKATIPFAMVIYILNRLKTAKKFFCTRGRVLKDG